MERTLLFLMLLFSFTSKVYSQDSALPKAARKGAVTREPALDKFEGKWIWTGAKRDTMKLTFKKMMLASMNETHMELIVADFIYIVEGRVVQDSRKRVELKYPAMAGWLDHEKNLQKNKLAVSFTDLITSANSIMCFELLNDKTAKWFKEDWMPTTYQNHPYAIPVMKVQWVFRRVSN